MRDRRWDFLYEREKRPVKEFILERFACELARELRVWPPPLDWLSSELRTRYAPGLDAPPDQSAIGLALALARLDLVRDLDGFDRLMTTEAPQRWRGPDGAAAGHLLVQFVIERCLALKEHAETARLTRGDLAGAVLEAEKRFTAGN